ncbi:MAG: hypothetical protein GQ574_09245 [Crocinitomix sp.]|nr:hypothetical protein [Crocinitomix sp.]
MRFLFLLSFLLGATSSIGQCEDFVITFVTNNPTCYGFSDGSVTANTTGGTGGSYFTITDVDDVVLSIDGSNTANTLPEGWYFIQAIDEEGCVVEDSIFIEQPGIMEIDLIVMTSNPDPDCDGSAIVDTVYNATGDYANISYYWTPNPSGINGIGTDTIYDFCPGDHTITVNDENGCSKVFDFVVGELVSIDESLDSQIQFVSNAVTGAITVQLNSFKEPLAINFYETSGRLVYSAILNETLTVINPNFASGTNIYTIDTADLILETGQFVVPQ